MPGILARLLPALLVAGLLALAYFGSSGVRKYASKLASQRDRTLTLFLVIMGLAMLAMLALAVLTTK